jgi:protein TonB
MIRTRTNIEVSGYGNMPGDATPPPPPPPPFLNLRSEDGKNPLILIDRKPFEGDLKTIDINTIEKIEVLKEQSATAMYGKKGENGVVLITTKKQASPSNDEVFVVVEEIPQFKGGPMALKSYLEKATAGSDEKGTVRLQFTVETDGSISKIKTVDSPSKALGEKAISILSSMPAWNPGKQRGKPVAVDYSILIEFK